MSSIYIHIPFCQCRCSYCDFYSTTQLATRDKYVKALCTELVERKNELPPSPIQTIYLGGGTPSVLSIGQLEQIFSTIAAHYNLSQLEECTIECNPDDVTTSFLADLQSLPINRISMGVQSFNDAELNLMNRRHTAKEAIAAVHNMVNAGYTNCSIDLIYGLPNQSIETWQSNLQTALSLPIKHLSAYHLTYEEGTKMYQLRQQAVSEDTSYLMFQTLHQYIEEAGMEAYEISNFAYPGYRSKHNSRYWQNKPYLGIGAAAHSYNGSNKRRWNVSDLTKYINGITQNNTIFEDELLSDDDLYNELIITSLRTKEGVNTLLIQSQYQPHFAKQSKKYLDSGMLAIKDGWCKLTQKGIFISDGIICDLMV
ncbi:MAG: radical SAM family heme chaperone HemW [Paludibacteraceae bacterium]|nr:radical SAM family heme chaperone HemW [Paludibacteraceae bacterium]